MRFYEFEAKQLLAKQGVPTPQGGLAATAEEAERIAVEIDACLQHFEGLEHRLGEAGVQPALTLLGITRLFLPELMIEIEATAVA